LRTIELSKKYINNVNQGI